MTYVYNYGGMREADLIRACVLQSISKLFSKICVFNVLPFKRNMIEINICCININNPWGLETLQYSRFLLNTIEARTHEQPTAKSVRASHKCESHKLVPFRGVSAVRNSNAVRTPATRELSQYLCVRERHKHSDSHLPVCHRHHHISDFARRIHCLCVCFCVQHMLAEFSASTLCIRYCQYNIKTTDLLQV